MAQASFTTPLGTCAIAWSGHHVTSFSLPDPDRGAAPPGEPPPPWVATVIDRVMRHCSGDLQDFSDVPFAFDQLASFHRAVLVATLAVKPGHTDTYGGIAEAIGQPASASRAVGAALGANPWPLLIPCHRILAAGGKMTGFSGPGGVATKARLLALEGAQLL